MKFDGRRLKDLRESKGVTQEQLAALVSANRVSVGQWEKGTHTPSLEMIGKIGMALGVPGPFFLVQDAA